MSEGYFIILMNFPWKNFGKEFETPSERVEEFNAWLSQLQMRHIDELRNLAGNGGKIYLPTIFQLGVLSKSIPKSKPLK